RIGGTVQGCYIAGHERLAAADLYFTNTVEVTDTDGVQVEVSGRFLGVVGVGHGGSPVSRENGDAQSLTGKRASVRVVKVKSSDERLANGKPMTIGTMRLGE